MLKLSRASEVENLSMLVTTEVGEDGGRKVLGIMDEYMEDKVGCYVFFEQLKSRGLSGVLLIISDSCMGLTESAAEFYSDA